MSLAPISACVVEESPELSPRLVATGDFSLLRRYDPSTPPDTRGASVLFVEDSDPSHAALARTRSFAASDVDVLLVVVVPQGVAIEQERALRQAGAFDVIELGPGLERALYRLAATARRVIAMREERAQLAAGLAHEDRLAAIGKLAASVSHEINTPIQTIVANLDSIRLELEALLARPRSQHGELLERYASNLLETVSDSLTGSRRISAIVRSLKEFARTTEATARLEPTSLNDEVQSVLRLVGKEARFQVKVELELDPMLPQVLAPAHTMTQVLTNLVVNALQALDQVDPAQRKLRIHTAADVEMVIVEVSDTGPGMPPEVVARIFDPFFTTKPSGQGTGLGLAITKELVRKAGGEILVDSELGRGTSFRVALPRPPPISVRPRPLSVPPPSIAHLRVLIVDDDELLLRALARALKQQFEVTTVASGRGALERLRKGEHFDVLVSDIVMPEMNGHELYVAIRELDVRLSEHAIFLSGGLQATALSQAITETGRALLEKPLSPRDLAKKIYEVAPRR
ncbi:MAG: ATP-binding protein [Sandaracinus sp.]